MPLSFLSTWAFGPFPDCCFFINLKMYTVMTYWHSNHTDPPQLPFQFLGGCILRNNIITAKDMIKILDCNHFCLQHFPILCHLVPSSPFLWRMHKEKESLGGMAIHGVHLHWWISHCPVFLWAVTYLLVGGHVTWVCPISAQMGERKIVLSFFWILRCTMQALDGQQFNL